jgi:RHS repeat-associated protein
MAVNGVFSYLGADGLGSVESATTPPSQSYTLFDPYGQVRYSSGTMPTDFGFTGQHTDNGVNGNTAKTGLDYYNARYYDPIAGQFTSADSLLPGGGFDLFGLSRYAYVEGNPVTRTDPSGHCFIVCAIVGAVVGGGIVYGAQVIGNIQKGESIGRALTDVNVGHIFIGVAVGFVVGGTLGLAAPAVAGWAASAGTTTVAGGGGTLTFAAAKLSGRVLEEGGAEGPGAGLAKAASSEPAADEGVSNVANIVFRGGSDRLRNLTPAEKDLTDAEFAPGVSTWRTAEQAFGNANKGQAIDLNKLANPNLQVIEEEGGHVAITAHNWHDLIEWSDLRDVADVENPAINSLAGSIKDAIVGTVYRSGGHVAY